MNYCADTWFILSLFHKNQQSLKLLQETRSGKTRIVIPMTVFAEATRKLLQQGMPHLILTQFWDGVEDFSDKVQLILLDKAIADEAARISTTFSLSLIDACNAASCKLTGCHTLLTSDSDYDSLVKRKYLSTQAW